ncbi:MAG: EAL domain-containing protein [Pseudomonadota bacterium]
MIEPHGTLQDPLTMAAELRDRDVLSMVATALRTDNLLFAYQPVVQSRDTSQIAFHEGLMRIKDPNGRVIAAKDFITQVEPNPLGREIDHKALQLGIAALHDEPNLRLSINMSARSVGYPAWNESLEKGLQGRPDVAERLILEITEASAMLMPDLVTVFMDETQDKGVSFALDNFGAGFMSFRYLREFFFDIVKIDGQFIEDIASNRDNQVLAKSLVSISQNFEMFTVAERVSNKQDAEYAQSIGIDCLQGYEFGAPSLERPSGAMVERLSA